MSFREIPTPSYDYQSDKLVSAYKQAMLDIQTQLKRIDLTDFERANALATMSSISKILRELDKTTAAWIAANIPEAVTDGVAAAILSLGVVDTLKDAKEIAKFNKLNKRLVEAVIADTQADLLAVTQNVERRVRTAIRQVAAESLRENVARGNNSTRALRRDIVSRLRATLDTAVDTGIIDARGRRWRPETYADMLVRTKMLEAHKESTINEALSRDVVYGVISSHAAKDTCRNWEGRIVKLSQDAPGDYPYINDLPRTEIFHPRCKHLVTPVRRPDRLPSALRELNGIN